jgi:hypothetical protein
MGGVLNMVAMESIESIKALISKGYTSVEIAEGILKHAPDISLNNPDTDQFYDDDNFYNPPPQIIAHAIKTGCDVNELPGAVLEFNLYWAGDDRHGRAPLPHKNFVEYIKKKHGSSALGA